MSLSRALRMNRILLVINVVILSLFIGYVFWGADLGSTQDIIEAKRIVLRGANGVPSMVLQGDSDNTLMTLNDSEGNVRLQLQGGAFPAVIIKNEASEIIGTFFPLRDGGAAVGLGDSEGNMATFIRGGTSPTMSFYKQSHEPNLSLGITDNLPHLIMLPMDGKEGLVIHGHTPASLLFIDEKGAIPVSLSRHGLHQANSKSESEQEHDDEGDKIFSSLKRVIDK